MTEKAKTRYKQIQIPEALIENAMPLFNRLGYRNPTEYIIEATRKRNEELTKYYFQMKELKNETE